MKRYLFAIPLAIAAPSIPQAASAQNTPMSTCASLASQWDNVEKSLASNLSSGMTDNSAPRATLRKLEDLEQLSKADMLYLMMKDNKCPLPTTPPSAATYLLAASTCDLERLRQRSADVPECKRETWKKSGE